MKHHRFAALAFATASIVLLSACSADSEATPTVLPTTSAEPPTVSEAPAALEFTSTDFSDGGAIPDAMTASAFSGTCDGDNVSPALEWRGAPEGTVSYAIVMLDSSHEDWVHWLLADIPADTTTLTAGAELQAVGVGGRNGMGNANYFGPCPMSPDHVYTLELWALDTELGLEMGFSHEELIEAADGHVLESALISGTRSGGS